MNLTDRIMLAVVEALEDEDPVVQIGVRENGLVLSWPAGIGELTDSGGAE